MIENYAYDKEGVFLAKEGKPRKGIKCKKTNEIIPCFFELNKIDAERLRDMTIAGQAKAAQDELRRITGCSVLWSVLWTAHAFCSAEEHMEIIINQ